MSPARRPSGERVRLGVLGAGRFGANYLRVLPTIAGASLEAVFDPDPRVREAHAGAAFTWTRSADELLDRGLDAIVIATPPSNHVELALAALDRGHHVLVEKPFATSVEDAERLAWTARRSGAVLLTGHLVLHFAGVAETLRASARVGHPLHSIHERLSDGASRSRENALWALGPHDVAVALRLGRATRLPERVRATGVRGADGVWDEVSAEAAFADGGTSRFVWSRAGGRARTLRIEGPLGSAALDEAARALETSFGPAEVFASEDALRRQCTHFLGCVRGSEAPVESLDDVLANVEVLAAMERSLHDEGRWVALSATITDPVLSAAPPRTGVSGRRKTLPPTPSAGL
ncbi:MAG: Gfo/Idh/MocA family oxidoreductase [Polyangiaceae bacterium]